MSTVISKTSSKIDALLADVLTGVQLDASGNLLFTTRGGAVFNAGKVQLPITPAEVLRGSIQMWATATAPTGYLLCNGGTFSSVTYPALAALLGDTYGTHAGTTYYLPDFRGRSPLGVGLASPAVAGGTTHTLAQKGGEEMHTMTTTEMAAHSHTINDPGHSHGMAGFVFQWGQALNSVYIQNAIAAAGNPPSNNLVTNQFAWNNTNGAGTGVTAANSGGGAAHNVTHPYLGINFIIKT